MARELVALVHEGEVRHPLVVADPDDERPGHGDRVLDPVGADAFAGPSVQPDPDTVVHLVTRRDGVRGPGDWRPPEGLVARALADVPPLRPPWFASLDWYDRVEHWLDHRVTRTGPLRVYRAWAISAVATVPTTDGELWFKAASAHFSGEARAVRALAGHWPDLLPEVLDGDDQRSWLLMRPLTGTTDATRAPGALEAVAPTLARWQLESRPLTAELPLPHRRRHETMTAFHELLDSGLELDALSPDELSTLLDLAPRLDELAEEFWAEIPDTAAHGDFHPGNVAWDGATLRLFDWTDACLTHPFLDAWHLAAYAPERTDLVEAYLATWRTEYPGTDQAWRLAHLMDLVFQAATYDGIARTTEELSRWELGGITPHLLRKIPSVLAELDG